ESTSVAPSGACSRILLADSHPRSITWMLAGRFTVALFWRASARAPRAFLQGSCRTRRRSRRACEGSLRTVPSRGSSCTRCCTGRQPPRPVRPCRSCVEPGGHGPRHLRAGPAPELAADELAGPQDLHQVDACFYLEAIEHVDYVLGRDVARGALGIGTAAETPHRAVEDSHARLERRVNVRQRLSVRIVVVTGELFDGHFCGDRFDH